MLVSEVCVGLAVRVVAIVRVNIAYRVFRVIVVFLWLWPLD